MYWKRWAFLMANQRSKKKEQNLNLPLTNYEQIRKDFPIIIDIVDGDGELRSTKLVIRKTILFDDGTKLLTREYIKNNRIAWFYYDYIDTNRLTLFKAHSEFHEEKKFQTITEPFHMHSAESLKLFGESRFPNFEHRNLRSIVEAIYIYRLISRAKDQN